MKNLLLFLFITFASTCSTSSFADWSGRWDFKGADAIIGLSSDPQHPDNAKNSLFVIGYSKKFSCMPVVSILVIIGQKLGSPLDQKTSKSKKNQLIITVDKREFTDETKMTTYTNGMELAMRGSPELIDALSNANNSFYARIGTTTMLNFSKASGFELANRQARINCN